MSFATIDALRESLAMPATKHRSPDYAAKMLHVVPKATVVDRVAFVLDQCRDRHVLELGASGALHRKIGEVAASVVGIDRESSDGVLGFDLDDVTCHDVPCESRPDVIVAGEILEHLSNPGWLLTRLARQWPDVPLVVTVPNAFSHAAQVHMEQGIENVNAEHCCWYSWKTATTLLTRHGYGVAEFYWYNGDQFTAEGLVFLCRQGCDRCL